MYLIKNMIKHSELDKWEEGCDPDTSQLMMIDLSFENEDLSGLIEDVSKFLQSHDYQIDPCEDDQNRIDWQVMETASGLAASETDLERWKKGGINLYLCTYSVYVYNTKPAPLKELLN